MAETEIDVLNDFIITERVKKMIYEIFEECTEAFNETEDWSVNETYFNKNKAIKMVIELFSEELKSKNS